jgi:hypothetical protein
MSNERHQAADAAAEQAEQIAGEGENIRERTRKAFVDVVSERRIGFDDLSHLAGKMLDGAAEAVKSAAPTEQESVLREVIDGLADGFSTSANAARLAMQEAKGRGETFVKDDVRRVADNLRLLEEMFFETVSHALGRAQEAIGGQARDLEQHARRAASQMRPSLEKAMRAAMDHPVEFAGEAVRTGAKAAPRAAGSLLQAVSGLLQGAGELLSGEGVLKPAVKSGDGEAAKKTPAKEPAPAKSAKKTPKKTPKKSAVKKKSAKSKKKTSSKKTKKKAATKKPSKKKAAKKKTAKKRVAKRGAKKKVAKKKVAKKKVAKKKSKKKSKRS